MEKELVASLPEVKREVLDKIAAILRWQKKATLSISAEGYVLTLVDGTELFFACQQTCACNEAPP